MEFIIIALGQILTFLLLIASTKLTTNLIDVSTYGNLVLNLLIVSILSQIFFSYLISAIVRFKHSALSEISLLDNFRYLLQLSSLSAFALGISFYLFISKDLTVIFLTFYLISQGLNMYLNAYQNARRNRIHVAIMNVSEGLIRTLMLLYFYNYAEDVTLDSVLVSYLVSSLVIFIINNYIFSFSQESVLKIKPRSTKKYTKNILNYGLPITYNSISYWLQTSSDKISISQFQSDYKLGGYSIIYQYGYTTVMLIFDVINSYITPIAFQKYADRTHRKYIFSVCFICIILSIIFLSLIYLNAEFLILTLTNQDYLQFSQYLPFISFAGIIFCFSQLLFLIKQAEKDVKELSNRRTLISLLGAFAMFPAAYLYSIDGVIFTMIVVNSMILFVTALSVWK